jgi:hypothetical protein
MSAQSAPEEIEGFTISSSKEWSNFSKKKVRNPVSLGYTFTPLIYQLVPSKGF